MSWKVVASRWVALHPSMSHRAEFTRRNAPSSDTTRHPDRARLEGEAQLLLARAKPGLGLAPLALSPAPGDEGDDAGGQHEGAVDCGALDGRPAALVRPPDHLGGEDAQHAVLEEHEADRGRIGKPVVVQREQSQEHEVEEVRLHPTAREVGQGRRRRHQPERGGHRPEARAQPGPPGEQGADQEGHEVDEHVRHREPPEEPDQQQDRPVGRQHAHDGVVATDPATVRGRRARAPRGPATLRKGRSAAGARGCRRGGAGQVDVHGASQRSTRAAGQMHGNSMGDANAPASSGTAAPT